MRAATGRVARLRPWGSSVGVSVGGSGSGGASLSVMTVLRSKRTFAIFTAVMLLLVINIPFPNEATYSESVDESLGAISDKEGYIDFISIGSLTKPELQQAQLASFGSHRAVRNFFAISELNDTDATCHETLTVGQVAKAVKFCKNVDGQSYDSKMMRAKLHLFSAHKQSPGWMCAQKRPIDGLHLALQRYKRGGGRPKYLIIMDDDTYFNMDALVTKLSDQYPFHEAAVVGGCIYTFPKEINFTFPVGGFGSILTRRTVENLMTPIYCDGNDTRDAFTRLACWRLNQNLVGEKVFFQEGMSVADLMYAYSAELPFTNLDKWTEGNGYCFHSDHTLGYFIGYYHVGVPHKRLLQFDVASEVPNDELRRKNYFSYTTIGGYDKQCKNERKKCGTDSLICHYTSPDQMNTLHSSTTKTTTAGAVDSASGKEEST